MNDPQIKLASGLAPAIAYRKTASGLTQVWPSGPTPALELLSVNVGAAGDVVEALYSGPYQHGADGPAGLIVTGKWGEVTLSYAGPGDANTAFYTASRPIEFDETGTLTYAYTPTGDGIKNADGVEMLATSGTVVSDSENYGGAALVAWPTDMGAWSRRARVRQPGTVITDTVDNTSANHRQPWLITEADLGANFWNYVRADGAGIKVRDSANIEDRAFICTRWDYANKRCSFLVAPSMTAAADLDVYFYIGNLADTTAYDDKNGVIAYGAAYFPASSLSGDGYLNGVSTLPFTQRAGQAALSAPAIEHKLCSGVRLQGEQCLYHDDLQHMYTGGVVPQYLHILTRLPASLPASPRCFGALEQNTAGFRGMHKEWGFRDGGAGMLQFYAHFGEGRVAYWDVGDSTSGLWGKECHIQIGIDAAFTGGSFSNDVVDVAAGMPIWIDGVRLIYAGASTHTDLITFSAEFGNRWALNGGGRAVDDNWVPMYGERGEPEISLLWLVRGQVYTDSLAAQANRLLHQSEETSLYQIEVNETAITGVILSFEAVPEKRYNLEIYEADGVTKLATPFAGLGPGLSGTVSRAWNPKDDLGTVVAAGNYILRIVEVALETVWQGTVGVTSFSHAKFAQGTSNNPYWRGFWGHADVCFTNDGWAHLAPGYNEQQFRLFRFLATAPSDPVRSMADNYRFNNYGICTDGTQVYVLSNFVNYENKTPAGGHANIIHRLTHNPSNTLTDLDQIGGGTSIGGDYVDPLHADDNYTVKFDSGIAVMELGDYLVASSTNRESANAGIRIWNKNTMAYVGAVDSGPAKRIAVLADDSGFAFAGDADDGTWRIGTLTDVGATNNIAWIVTGLADAPIDIAVDPVEGHITVYHGGGRAQVEAFNLAGVSQWMLGQAGGYRDGTTIVADDKYDPISFRRMDPGQGVIEFDKTGQLWLYDAGCKRWLVHNPHAHATPRVVNHQEHIGLANYFLEVDPGDPERIVSENLEYTLVYGTGNTVDWQLTRNLRHHPLQGAGSENDAFRFVRTMTHSTVTKKVGFVDRAGIDFAFGLRAILINEDGTFTDTGLNFSRHNSFDQAGNQTRVDTESVPGYEVRYEKLFTGWDVNGYPTWEANWTETNRWPWADPNPQFGLHGQTSDLGVPSLNGPIFNPFADGSFPVYRNSRNQSFPTTNTYHYGVVPNGGNDFTAVTMRGGYYHQNFLYDFNDDRFGIIWNPNETWGVFPDGMDTASGAYGNRVYAAGDYALLGQHGELQMQGQALQLYIEDKNGSFIEQFGRNNFAIKNHAWPVAEISGNNFAIHLVQAGNGEWYALFNDEGGCSAPHVYWLKNLYATTKTDKPLTVE